MADPLVLTDTDHLRNLLGRYCRLVDSADFAGLGAMFARGVLTDPQGRVLARGADEVERHYAMLLLHGEPATPQTQHLVLNTIVEPAPQSRARAVSSYVVLQATEALALQPIIAGSYDDTFARDDDGWYFVERRFSLQLSGRLDQHIPGFRP